MQFDIARDERSDKLCIGCRASATASDGLANIMDLCFASPIRYAQVDRGLPHLFAVFICDNRACGSTCVRTEYDPIFEKAADDSCTGACGIWYLHAFAFKESIAIGGLKANSLKNRSTMTHRFAFEKSNPDRGRWTAADMSGCKSKRICGIERRRARTRRFRHMLS
jgi:hypothetical protein